MAFSTFFSLRRRQMPENSSAPASSRSSAGMLAPGGTFMRATIVFSLYSRARVVDAKGVLKGASTDKFCSAGVGIGLQAEDGPDVHLRHEESWQQGL